jgi:UDP-glucose 4-epimerase
MDKRVTCTFPLPRAGNDASMKVVIVGATGNVGTSLIDALQRTPEVREIVGVARRAPRTRPVEGLRWIERDIQRDDLMPAFDGADAVVHLAWAIQPSHDEPATAATNVLGSGRVFEAVAAAGVPALVYASSVGAYVDGPKDRLVDETWPIGGIETSFYARHKGTVERMLDRFERDHGDVRVVRMRPGLIFKRGQAAEAHRFFLGRLVPGLLLNPRLLPVLPRIEGLSFQAVHTDDVAAAYRAAVLQDVRGAFNLVSEPVLDLPTIAEAISARTLPVPPWLARAAIEWTWRARLQPTPPGWLEMGLRTPLLSSERARRELRWRPERTSLEAVVELLEGIAAGAGEPTPALAPSTGPPTTTTERTTDASDHMAG